MASDGDWWQSLGFSQGEVFLNSFAKILQGMLKCLSDLRMIICETFDLS